MNEHSEQVANAFRDLADAIRGAVFMGYVALFLWSSGFFLVGVAVAYWETGAYPWRQVVALFLFGWLSVVGGCVVTQFESSRPTPEDSSR